MLKGKKLGVAFSALDKVIGILLISSVLCLVFLLAHKSLFDLDIWLHLSAGKYILQNRTVPAQDIFSFTVSGKSWIDHSWLFQVISYLVYSGWQADGLILLESLILTMVFMLLFIIGYRSIGSYLEAAVFLLFAVFASVDRFNIRPDIFSLLFFAAYLYFLRFHLEDRFLWFLVPIQVLWVNIHGYFILGPLLIFIFILTQYLSRRLGFLPKGWREESALSEQAYLRLKRFFWIIILCAFANPHGLAGAGYPLRVLQEVFSGENRTFFKYIQELKPTLQAYHSWAHYYNIIAFFSLALLLVNFKRIRLTDVMLFVFFCFFGLVIRNSAFFVFINYLIIVTYLGRTLRSFSSLLEFRFPAKSAIFYLVKCGVQIALVVFLINRIEAVLLESYYDFEKYEVKSALIGADERNYPGKAVDFILEHGLGPDIFNDFNSGAYLVGRAYPRVRVFIDGRTELYGAAFFKEYARLLEGDASVFEKTMRQYNLDTVLLTLTFNSAPAIARYLYRSPQWRLVFLDPYAVIFLKENPRNEELIKRYALDLNRYTPPKVRVKDLPVKWVYPAPYIIRASFFELLKEEEAVIGECKEALRIVPNCARAYHLLGRVYLRRKAYGQALEALRAACVLMPWDTDMRTDLARCFREMGEENLALEALNRVLRAKAKHPEANYQLGLLYLESGKEKEALDPLSKAVRYSPKEARYSLALARAYLTLAGKCRDGSYLAKARQGLGKAEALNTENDEQVSAEISSLSKQLEKTQLLAR
jgi:tetratricopeptide (TPR) repeat protein